MTTVEVENMSADELNAQKKLLPDSVREEPELAERYIQARLDAKQRDQRMSEMGVEITAKDARIAQLEDQVAALQRALDEAATEAARREEKYINDVATLNAQVKAHELVFQNELAKLGESSEGNG